jgi:ketosteroid isomerase-like protein
MPPNAIEAVVGWMDAMRRGDLDGAAGWFHRDVTWKGVPDDAVCRNRDDVLAMLRDSLTPCPDAPRSYRIAAVADYALRGEALEAAGAAPPDWR